MKQVSLLSLPRVWALRQAALWFLMFRKPGLALRCWDRILSEHPGHPGTLSAKAHLLARTGQESQAIALLEQLLGSTPDRPYDWFNLGFLKQAEGFHAEALLAFDKAIALDATLDRAWYGSGLSLLELDRLQEAVAALKKNTQMQPLSPYGWYQLAMAYHRLGESAEVAKVVRQLAQFEPEVARQLERDTAAPTGSRLK